VAADGTIAPSLWEALLASGVAGFACAIGVHYSIGYLIPTHLAPAWAGALIYGAAMTCTWPRAKTSPGLQTAETTGQE
jgi:hypothetical protein